MTRTGPSGPSASTDGLGGGESLRQAPFLVDISLFGAAVMFFSSSSGLPIFPWDQELVYCMFGDHHIKSYHIDEHVLRKSTPNAT